MTPNPMTPYLKLLKSMTCLFWDKSQTIELYYQLEIFLQEFYNKPLLGLSQDPMV